MVVSYSTSSSTVLRCASLSRISITSGDVGFTRSKHCREARKIASMELFVTRVASMWLGRQKLLGKFGWKVECMVPPGGATAYGKPPSLTNSFRKRRTNTCTKSFLMLPLVARVSCLFLGSVRKRLYAERKGPYYEENFLGNTFCNTKGKQGDAFASPF